MDQDIRHSRKPCRHIGRLQFHLLLVALLYPAGVSGQVGDTFAGPVIRVADGDTISVRRDGETVRIRLDGIDTPESDQPFGTTASAFTSAQVLNQHVTVHVRDVDRYGRLVSRVHLDDQDLSVALVAAGLAWHYTRYSDDPVLAQAEVQARTTKTGLWSQLSPIPPWEFRRRSRPR